MVAWNDIRQWDAREVSRLARRVSDAAGVVDDIGHELVAAVDRMQWTGDAADAARETVRALSGSHVERAGELGAIGQCIDTVADSMYPLLTVMRECESTAADNSMLIDAAGVVSARFPIYAVDADSAWDTERERRRVEQSLDAHVVEVLRRATDIDTRAAAALAGIGGDEPGDLGEYSPARALLPADSTPAAHAAFWKTLTPSQRTSLLEHDPGSIGNLDGIPAEVRDTANRRMLTLERTRLRRVADHLSSQLAGERFGGLLTHADAGLAQTVRRLDALDAIARTLEQGNRQLLVLDNSSSEDTLAAIGIGDVHTATHVAVFVPGLGSDVRGDVERYDGDLAALGRVAEKTLPEGESVACVTWMNYQAPHVGWSLLDPQRTVLAPLAASVGAPRLTAFLDGLDAARGQDPHLSLLGHSYGSLVAAMSLQGVADAGVDEFVALGSAGLGVDDVDRLSVPPGNLFVAEAQGDVVADLGVFGGDPSRLDGIVALPTGHDAEAATSKNVGHSDYLTPGTTTQRQVADVVTGRLGDTSN